jgi:hypothetical protein
MRHSEFDEKIGPDCPYCGTRLDARWLVLSGGVWLMNGWLGVGEPGAAHHFLRCSVENAIPYVSGRRTHP